MPWNPGAPWLWTVPDHGTVPPGESTTLTVRVDGTGLSPGVYEGMVTLQTNAGRTPWIDVPVTLVVPAYRKGVDAGGSAGYTDTAGDPWTADQPYRTGGLGYVGTSSVTTTKKSIGGTVDDPLYASSREGMTGYRFDRLPAGTYQVELGFAELRGGVIAGRCVFDVSVNGDRVLTGHDVAAEVGTLAADRHSFFVTVSEGGSNRVDFGAYKGKLPPFVNTIRITHRPDR